MRRYEMMKYKLKTLTLDGHILNFTISKYQRVGDSFEFIDEKTGDFKCFPASRTSIEEVMG